MFKYIFILAETSLSTGSLVSTGSLANRICTIYYNNTAHIRLFFFNKNSVLESAVGQVALAKHVACPW